jgi:anti-anti-sigma regulatory factor
MEMIAVWLKIDEQRVSAALEEAREKLDSAEGEVMLDFSSVQSIHVDALKSLEQFADAAHQKDIKVVLRGVNAAIFKVLRLVSLSSRFSFVN